MHMPAPFAAVTALRRVLPGFALGIGLIAGYAPIPAAALLAGLAPAPGVTVEFVDPDRFADIGRHRSDRERASVQLVSAFKTLAATRLKAAQSMDFQVLNVDLAGYLVPSAAQSVTDIRVRRIGLDPAVIVFRWTLWQDGHAVSSGEERLTHVDVGGQTARESETLLGVERGMLERWFDSRLGRPSEHLGARRQDQP